ncbi:MAG: class I SAM-dependent methyltransferase [Clostridiales bacterium]|nr:class I SAM-dependent methyltransferase [Clostridiales bacterium]
MEQYANLSLVYDKLMDVDYNQWTNFLVEYFKTEKKELKYKKCLELGCGTGNMTVNLKKLGMDVTALDSSDDMLTKAEEKLRQLRYKVNFLKQDIRSFILNRKYEYIFSFCDCFNYILKEEDLKKSFINVYNHLDDNGYFVFDISTEYKLKEVIGEKTFTLNQEDVCYIWDNYIKDDIIEMYITFFVKEGKLYRRFDERHIQSMHKVYKLEQILKAVGFKEVYIFDDYNLKPYNDKSMRAVFIAKK